MKRNYRILLLLVVLAAGGLIAINVVIRNSNPDSNEKVTPIAVSDEAQPTTVAQAKQHAPNPLPACLQENKQVPQEGSEQQDIIAQEVVGQLDDVPAGTNVPVLFATFDESGATGVALYPEDYGTYNFIAKKDSSKQFGWKITSFITCKN